MKSLIVGRGEIGKALYDVLTDNYCQDVDIIDEESDVRDGTFDIMHICFPYSEGFASEVKRYQALYTPTYTVIHSTVPVGTSRKLEAIHSPVIGLHPFIKEGLKTFVKYLSGDKAGEVADYFRRAGIKVYLFDKQETTELLKILDTTLYAVNIEYTKDIKRQCEKYGVPFEAWSIYNHNYNEGYKKLGFLEYVRPELVPIMTRQGGHCTRNNCDLLDTPFTKLVKELND